MAMESPADLRADDQAKGGDLAPREPVMISVAAAEEEAGVTSCAAVPALHSVFKEVLEDPHSPIPTADELETFGLFDVSESERRLAEYRLLHPSPLPSPATSPVVANVRSRGGPLRQSSDPQNRYSLSALQLPPYWPTTSPLSSPSDSPRLNPFAFVRKPGARPRLSLRTKSATEVPSLRASRSPSTLGSGKDDDSSCHPAAKGLDRDATLKADKRSSVRKLRKAPPPRISVRTDETALLRPVVSQDRRSSLTVDTALHDSHIRSRRTSCTSNASSSYPHSPLSYEPEDLHVSLSSRDAAERRDATVAKSDFLNRREGTSSSVESLHYQADNERNRSSPRAARSTRSSFGFASSPTSSIPSPNRWVKPWGFDRIRRGGHSMPSSPTVATGSAATAVSVDKNDRQTFEVLSRPALCTDSRRSLSADVVPTNLRARVLEDALPLDSSDAQAGPSANEESNAQPEPLESLVSTKRSAACTSRTSLARGISYDSMRTPSGCTTPAVVSTASSGTIRRPDTAGGASAADLARSTKLSALLLASTLGADSGDSDGKATDCSPHEDDVLDSSRANSAAGSSGLSSSSSHSRSRDSLSYCSGDETPASSAVETDDVFVRGSNDEDDGSDEFDIGKAPILLGVGETPLHATPTVPRLV
ncbi:hypothetical protein JCM10908_003081 [Rhodotorula pacifica]|uniref:uncharacterized protein n=1 Tax=Rhodotorula pacifica TaxID=1495444 RepID=UPI00316C77B1